MAVSVLVGELACTIVAIRNTLEHTILPELAYGKILDNIYINYPSILYFFSSAILVNAFISSFYFYVNIGNIRARIIRFSIVKKYEKLKQILIMPPGVIKICFSGKGSEADLEGVI